MTRAVRVPGTRAPRVRPPYRGASRHRRVGRRGPAGPRMRGAFASAFRSAGGRFGRRGCSPITTMTRQRRVGGAGFRRLDDVRGRGRRRADVDADDPGTDDVPPPARRAPSAPRRASRRSPDSARAQRRAATFSARRSDWTRPSRRAHGARPRASGGRGRRRRPRVDPSPRRVARRSGRARRQVSRTPPDGRRPRGHRGGRAAQYFAAMGGDPQGQMAVGTGTCTASRRPNRAPPRRCITRLDKAIGVNPRSISRPTPNVEKTRLTPDTEGGDGGQARSATWCSTTSTARTWETQTRRRRSDASW